MVKFNKTEKGLWDYIEKWEKEFSETQSLIWKKSWLSNDYCKTCRFCCGRQDSAQPFPMPLLDSQLHENLHDNFYLLDCRTPYLGEIGCKSNSEKGCKLALQSRPIACGLFPIVLVNGCLYLYLNCPAVLFTPLIKFANFAKKAADYLLQFSLDDLRHLSLSLTDNILATSYIDLHIKLFDENGLNPVLQ